MKVRIILTLCLLLSLKGFAAKMQSIDIKVDGQTRNMLVYTPDKMKDGMPLLIVTHGMNQNPEYQRDNDNWNTVVDEFGFVLCYLRSVGNTWDIGGQGDLNFVRQSTVEMQSRFKVNKNRMYWTGFSMGTMLLYHGIENGLGSIFAAFAPCSGIKFGSPWQNTKEPVSVIHCHSKHDDVFPIDQYQPRDYAAHFATDVDKCKNYTKTVNYMPPGGWDNGDKEVWTDGLKGSEVEIFMCNGGGHWPTRNYIREIWAFFSRHSKVEGPKVASIYPEDGSFDMTADNNRQFRLSLTKPVADTNFTATLSHNTTNLKLQIATEDDNQTLLLSLPTSTKSLTKGDWTLTVKGMTSQDGGVGTDFISIYKYGIEEVGDELHIDTLYQTAWADMKETIGEGIPKGWRCKVTDASDKVTTLKPTDSIESARASHLVFFDEGQDFTAGFQFYPSKGKKVELYTYDSSSRVLLRPGKMAVSFKAAYLNSKSRSNKFPLKLTLTNPSDNSVLYTCEDIMPKGYKTTSALNSSSYELIVDVAKGTRYNLSLSAEHTPGSATTLDCIIISDILVTTTPSPADLYKGGFLRTLHKAQALLESAQANPSEEDAAIIEALAQAIAELQDFTSVQPSDYTAATKTLEQAMAPVIATGLQPLLHAQPSTTAYDLQGRRVTPQHRGLYIQGGKLMKK